MELKVRGVSRLPFVESPGLWAGFSAQPTCLVLVQPTENSRLRRPCGRGTEGSTESSRGAGWGWLWGRVCGRPGILGANMGHTHRWPQESPWDCQLSLLALLSPIISGGCRRLLVPGWDSSGFSIVPRSSFPLCGACTGQPEGSQRGQVGRCEGPPAQQTHGDSHFGEIPTGSQISFSPRNVRNQGLAFGSSAGRTPMGQLQ